MNYDLDTKEGLQNAIVWTNRTLSHLHDGGVWAVPRSGTLITVTHGLGKRCSVISHAPDPSIYRVLDAAGWTVESIIVNTL